MSRYEDFKKFRSEVADYKTVDLLQFTRPGITVTTKDLLTHLLQNPDKVLPVYQVGLNQYGKLERANVFAGIKYRSNRVILYKCIFPSNFLLSETSYDLTNRTVLLITTTLDSLSANVNKALKSMKAQHIDVTMEWFMEGKDLKNGLKSLSKPETPKDVYFDFTIWSSLIEEPSREVPFIWIRVFMTAPDVNGTPTVFTCREYSITLNNIDVIADDRFLPANLKGLIMDNIDKWDEIRTVVNAEAKHQQQLIINSKIHKG